MDKSWIDKRLEDPYGYDFGVRLFLDWVFHDDRLMYRFGSKGDWIYCPCKKCLNTRRNGRQEVYDHLILNGWFSKYDVWTLHGEEEREPLTDNKDNGIMNMFHDGLSTLRHVSQREPPLDEATHVQHVEQVLPKIVNQRSANLWHVSQQPPSLHEATHVPLNEQEILDVSTQNIVSVSGASQMSNPNIIGILDMMDNSEKNEAMPIISNSTNSRKPGGLARNIVIAQLMKGETYTVVIKGGDVVGNYNQYFHSQMSILALRIFPIWARDFRVDVTVEMKVTFLKRLGESFTWDQTPMTNKLILLHAAELLQTKRHKLKKEYFNPNIPISEILENVPEDLHADEWKKLVNYWISPKYKMVKTRRAPLRRVSQQLPLVDEEIQQEQPEMVKKRRPPLRRVSDQQLPLLDEVTHVPQVEEELPEMVNQQPEDEATRVPSTEEIQETSDFMNSRKKPRGPARSVAVAQLRKGETYTVIVKGGDAVGDHSQFFHSQMGILVRLIFPIWAHDFRVDVTYEMKVTFLKRLGESFNWDRNETNDKLILKHAAELLRYKRHRLKREYFDPELPISEILENVPEDLHKDEWRKLVDYWTSSKYKEMEERNKRNRSKLQVVATHRMGRKNFNQLEHELDSKGIEVNRPNLFLHSKSREGSDGSRIWRDDTYKKQYELMINLSSQSEGQDPTTKLTPDAAYLEATGSEHPRRVRGVGRGVTPNTYYGRGTSTNSKVDRLEKKMEAQNARLKEHDESLHARLQDYDKRLEEYTTLIKKMMEIISNQQGTSVTQRISVASRASDAGDFNGMNEDELDGSDYDGWDG